jgi:uncharacterized membrane protein
MDLQGLVNSDLARELVVFLIAMAPVAELRGAIPVAIDVFGMPWYTALGISVVGNMLPVPFILLFLEYVQRALRPIKLFDRFFTWLFAYTRKKTAIIERYEFVGLLLFVAVPLPLTGAWTGSVAAFLLGMRFWPSFLSILGGVLIAGIIVTVLSLLGWTGAIIAGVALGALAVLSAFRFFRGRPNAAPPLS